MALLRINPGLRVLMRASGALQLGRGPSGVLLDGTDEADRAFVAQLRQGLDQAELDAAAARCRISPARARSLLAALAPVLVAAAGQRPETNGLRTDRLAPDRGRWSAVYGCDGAGILAARGAAVVQVIGLGRTGAAIACALAAAGVGTLLLEDPLPVGPADVGAGSFRIPDIGLNRAVALRRLVHQIDPSISCYPVGGTGSGTGPGAPGALTLAVSTHAEVADAAVATALMSRGHPHLCVLSREQDVLVGPLVVPGESACLECLNLHHADTDPDWYELSAGLAAQARGTSVDEACLSAAAGGLAALQALLFVDGRNRPAAWSAVLQLRPADGLVVRHEYRQHPGCGCALGPAAGG